MIYTRKLSYRLNKLIIILNAVKNRRLAEGIVLHVAGCVAVEACTRREADVFDVRLTASSLFISFYQWE